MTKPPSVQASEYAEVTVTAYLSLPTPLTVDTLVMMINNAFMAGFQSGMKEGEEEINRLNKAISDLHDGL